MQGITSNQYLFTEGPMNPQQTMYTQSNINQQLVNGGFGDMFYNMNDPHIAKTNVPVKQDSSLHTMIIITTLFMIGGIVIGAIGFGSFLVNYAVGLVIGLPYLFYLVAVICFSDIRGYITNLKKFDQYKEIYDSMVKGRGYFAFWIQCYHYRTIKRKGRTKKTKVVTHTATQQYYPNLSQDVSGNITGIEDITKYVFINYLKKFYFVDKRSEQNFNNRYRQFVNNNKRDQHQTHTHTFNIEGFQEEVGFCALGEGSHNTCMFYLTAILGFSLIYSCILERSASRYSINIVKKLTC